MQAHNRCCSIAEVNQNVVYRGLGGYRCGWALISHNRPWIGKWSMNFDEELKGDVGLWLYEYGKVTLGRSVSAESMGICNVNNVSKYEALLHWAGILVEHCLTSELAAARQRLDPTSRIASSAEFGSKAEVEEGARWQLVGRHLTVNNCWSSEANQTCWTGQGRRLSNQRLGASQWDGIRPTSDQVGRIVLRLIRGRLN